MEKLTEVLAMGGYGAYIWPAFGLAALVMGCLAVGSLRSLKHAAKALGQLQNPNET